MHENAESLVEVVVLAAEDGEAPLQDSNLAQVLVVGIVVSPLGSRDHIRVINLCTVVSRCYPRENRYASFPTVLLPHRENMLRGGYMSLWDDWSDKFKNEQYAPMNVLRKRVKQHNESVCPPNLRIMNYSTLTKRALVRKMNEKGLNTRSELKRITPTDKPKRITPMVVDKSSATGNMVETITPVVVKNPTDKPKRITPMVVDKSSATGNMVETITPVVVENPQKKVLVDKKKMGKKKKSLKMEILDESPANYKKLSKEEYDKINIDAQDVKKKGRKERGKWLKDMYEENKDPNNPFFTWSNEDERKKLLLKQSGKERENEIAFIIEEIESIKVDKESMEEDFKYYKEDNKPTEEQFKKYKDRVIKTHNKRLAKAKKP